MSGAGSRKLEAVAQVIRRFELTSLLPSLNACTTLSGDDASLDVAVLGQFKSGKSSLLNAVLGEPIFPVGVVPVTAVITRASAGKSELIRVTRLDGTVEKVPRAQLAEFVTEKENPSNGRAVALVDVFVPALRDWPGLRLVDTPGLGSVLAHSEATRTWLPNVAAALVTISAERPLSDEDRRLLTEARQTAPRVVVLLTKVDLLSAAELAEVTAFLERGMLESFGTAMPLLPFSCRQESERWVRQLQETVLSPIAQDVAGERRAALALKTTALIRACRGYLSIGLRAAERADADRERLRAAVLTESVKASVIGDELRQAEQVVHQKTRPAFEEALLAQEAGLQRKIAAALASELPMWRGNLAEQSRRYEAWLAQRLTAELTVLSKDAVPVAVNLVTQAEERLRRVVEAFRDRLGRNIQASIGVDVSPAVWEVVRPQLDVVPVAVGQTFMTPWELLSWLLPMWLIGGIFRRHVLGRLSWEVTKNLTRLANDWAGAVDAAVASLRTQASTWVDTELATLDRLLKQRPAEANRFAEALQSLQNEGEGSREPGS
jgi:GTP-binding protein EngB required for normal cell division